MKSKVFEKILSSVEEDLSLKALDKALEMFQDPEEVKLASSLVARAYLACLNLDGSHIHRAIELFEKVGDKQGLEDCLLVAKHYKNFRALSSLQKALDIADDELFDGLSRAEWFQRYGIIWFDLYQDTDLNISFVKEEDFHVLKEELANIVDPKIFWKKVFADIKNDRSVSEERKAILRNISKGLEPFAENEPREDKRTAFKDWCHENGITIIRQLQIGRSGASQRSDVYLVRDSDGKFKVMKEELLHYLGPFGDSYSQESELYDKSYEFDFLPMHFGIDQVAGAKYLRQSYEYGRTLEEYISAKVCFSHEQAIWIISDLARKLTDLLKRGLMYLDFKPANVMVVDGRIKLIDLGLSRIVEASSDEVPIYLPWPDYAAPENIFRFTASQKTLVYQLGLLYHELVHGRPLSGLKIDPENREQKILGHAWHVAMGGEQERIMCLPSLIRSMLDIDPRQRPDLDSIAYVKAEKFAIPMIGNGKTRKKEKNTVLFPARMGIPHKGHIEFMARLLELGYYLIISIQRSYTITDRDPLPKWIVVKIVAQSLFDKGYTADDFEFRLTPFYKSDLEHRMHFAMMPGMEDVVAFASGNVSTHHLFPGKQHISQADVFGFEDETYEIRSWGEIIRGAVRSDDEKTFSEYAASGMGKIISFDEIKEIYGKPKIEFVQGKTCFTVRFQDQEIKGRVNKYMTAEEAIVLCFNQKGIRTALYDHYAKDTVLEVNGQRMALVYDKTILENNDLNIYYHLA